jgi:sugar transferase (PEP-CTERM/EpsH1 system associated)
VKILYLSHRIPYPPNKGDKIRSFNTIKHLARSHEVHLACLADDPGDLAYERNLMEYCARVCVVPISIKSIASRLKALVALAGRKPLSVACFYSSALQKTIDAWLSSYDYDAVICYSSCMPEYLFRSPSFQCAASTDANTPHRFGKARNFSQKVVSLSAPLSTNVQSTGCRPRLIMDFCDVDSDKWVQYSHEASLPFSAIYRTEGKRLLDYEKRVNQVFDHSIFISRHEAGLFSRLCPEARDLAAISNGVDHEYFSPQPPLAGMHATSHHTNRPTLLFTGAMDYHANVDGMAWFCRQVLPLIRSKHPEVELQIVGRNPHARVKDLHGKNGVTVVGAVDDIRPYYQTATVCVIPLRLARGVQNKVLEAMSMAKATVSTSKAVEGIEAQHEAHVLVGDTPHTFADAVLRLLSDRDARTELGKRAREFVVQQYDWTANLRKLDALLGMPQDELAHPSFAKAVGSIGG